MALNVVCSNETNLVPIDEQRLVSAVKMIASDFKIETGEISLVLKDDAQIREINKEFLDHDWPTDVISFPLVDEQSGHLEGELVVSVETAIRISDQLPWTADDETLLYVIHGMLHLVGFEDETDTAAAEMRISEREYLQRFNVPCAQEHGKRLWVDNDANDQCELSKKSNR